MIKRLILFILIILSFFTIGFSTDISTCPATILSSGNYNVTAPMSTAGICFNIQSDDVSINCNNFMTTGTPAGAFVFSNTGGPYKNISVYNCGVEDFGYGVFMGELGIYSTNLTLENLSFENINVHQTFDIQFYNGIVVKNISIKHSTKGAFGMWLINSGSRQNIFEDIYIENVSEFVYNTKTSVFTIVDSNSINFKNIQILGSGSETAIHMSGTASNTNNFTNINITNYEMGINNYRSGNNNFENVKIINTSTGFNLDGSSNNIFNNVYVDSSVASLNLSDGGLFDTTDNIFSNSYLGNYSKIISTNWSLTTPNNFTDNTYLIGTDTGLCFDNPLDLNCEVAGVVAPVSAISLSATSLPSFGVWSILVSLLLIGGLLI